jgi:hypothetical protein
VFTFDGSDGATQKSSWVWGARSLGFHSGLRNTGHLALSQHLGLGVSLHCVQCQRQQWPEKPECVGVRATVKTGQGGGITLF